MKLILFLAGVLIGSLYLSGVKAKYWPLCLLAVIFGYLMIWFGAELFVAVLNWMFQ